MPEEKPRPQESDMQRSNMQMEINNKGGQEASTGQTSQSKEGEDRTEEHTET
jgi:hypothetical protein